MKHLYLVIWLCLPLSLLAQPVNDECATAIELTELQNWCSDADAYNNGSATQSAQDLPRCQAQGTNPKDVWFSLKALGTDLSIRVIGETDREPGGTLSNPEVTVYEGTCSTLNEIGCNSDAFNAAFVELLLSEITPGRSYLIRVSGRNGSSGSFQLCVNSFNNVADPNSDCKTGVVLCDKSSFVVEALSGVGSDKDEAQQSCLGDGGVSERSSAWYKWVAGTSGLLTFTLTPSNPSDDLDFAVYELPNGLSDCSDKIVLRCMASGETIGCPTSAWEPCSGPTGLDIVSSDEIETLGCSGTTHPCLSLGDNDDNFLSAISMEAGKAYALIVNNYTQSGNGFSIEFGGTAEFLGPEADFLTDDQDGTICFGDRVTFFDQSSFGSLAITRWSWNFGEGAIPQLASGVGPHQVKYAVGGIKSVALTVESETGCLVTTIGSVIVENPFDIEADIVHQTCPESIDGSINLNINSSSNVVSIQWNNGLTGPTLTSLPPGDYAAVIANFNGCDTMVQYVVEAPIPLEIEEIITRPSCGAGSDGSITLNVNGQAPPFLFDFNRGAGFTTSNALNGLPAAIYEIQIQDNNGCVTDLTVPLGEINVELDPDFEAITSPTCFGFTNGSVEIHIVGGDPTDYAYDWHADGGYVMSNILDGVRAGPLFVAVRDPLNCLGFISLDVGQPDELVVNIDTHNISCFGEIDGALTPQVFGGTGSYSYEWSNNSSDSVAVDLNIGQYSVTVSDANGCQSMAAGFIEEPPRLAVSIDSTRDVLCFGESTGSIHYLGEGGSPPFTYSIDGRNFTDALQIEDLPAGIYNLVVRDERGCTQSLQTEIFQPVQLTVDAGPDTTVDLGYSIQLFGTHQPIGKPVLYQWSPAESLGCQDCPRPIASPLQSTTYLVTIVDDDNCSATDHVEVLVFLNRPVYIPNSFTPNGDGFNDRLTVYGGAAALGLRQIQIYDRWGEMVYRGSNLPLNDENIGWDGTHQGQLLNPGVFVYIAEIEFLDRSVLSFEGNITLVR